MVAVAPPAKSSTFWKTPFNSTKQLKSKDPLPNSRGKKDFKRVQARQTVRSLSLTARQPHVLGQRRVRVALVQVVACAGVCVGYLEGRGGPMGPQFPFL